ncbi:MULTISPECIES: hypothetical protein [Acetobacter]|uniref:hypothetical protein n=1 Tax=Acetobacter TaxID=434 RepID=UPI00047188B4|nr:MULTISPECIES: hypothetical protein [Acetobacter]
MSTRFLRPLGCCLVLGLLAGCAAQPAAQQKVPLQTFPANMAIQQGTPANESQLTNDPSAPANTPLCGTAARESQAMAVQNYPQPLASGNSCVQNACFNTQTGTYIAADGSARVCR